MKEVFFNLLSFSSVFVRTTLELNKMIKIPTVSEFSSENPVQTGSSKLPTLISFLYHSFNVASNSYFLIFLSGFFLTLKRDDFFVLKRDTWSQASKPSARILFSFRTFSVSHHSSVPFPRSPSVFSPHLLPFEHSNLAATST